MNFQESFLEAAQQSTHNSQKLQQLVRKELTIVNESQALKNIADAVSLFKVTQENSLQGKTLSSEELKDARKSVNNVINDVSRICREVSGMSIVCTSRKNHTYVPQLPKPRTTATPAAIPVVTSSPEPISHDAAMEYIKANPFQALLCILKNSSSDEFMDLVRRAKKVVDSLNSSTL